MAAMSISLKLFNDFNQPLAGSLLWKVESMGDIYIQMSCINLDILHFQLIFLKVISKQFIAKSANRVGQTRHRLDVAVLFNPLNWI